MSNPQLRAREIDNTLESILSTADLERRAVRPPDHAAENRVLVSLMQCLSQSPDHVIQMLTNAALELCQAQSSGISLLSADGSRFYWPAVAGQWAAHVGGGTPREFGPCGTVLDRDAPLLFTHPERYFTYLDAVSPGIEEALLLPFYVDGKAVGTIWVIAHDTSRRFDREDLRMITALGDFASAAYHALTAVADIADELEPRGVTRRAFGQRTLAAGMAVAGAAALEHFTTPLFAQQTFVDADILQFALNLEYLEAEFYTVAVTGLTLKQSGFTTGFVQGKEGDTTGGAKVALSGSALTAATAIMLDEQAHVRLLQGALGGRAVSKPAINLNALNLGYRNVNEFLTLSRAFEDTGVSAYGGAAPLIRDGAILGTAARILATEAEHTGIIRLLISQTAGFGAVPALDTKDILPIGSANGKLVSADDNGLTAIRTPYQVLNIVYGAPGVGNQRGGFFPDGVNGAFNTIVTLA